VLVATVVLAGSVALSSGAAEPSRPAPPTLRLGDTARPLRQAVVLELRPDAETFSGTADIEVELHAATTVLWLNGTNLTVREAALRVKEATLVARMMPGGEDFIGFTFDRPVGPGAAWLHIEYAGVISRRDTEGLFAQQEGGDWYAFTQFEPLGARKAFPCFDEPNFKIPWNVSLRVPRELVALSNAPELSTAEHDDGTKSVTFAQTKPLPSYLVALGVGPFELVDAGKAGRNGTPVRIVTPRGKAREARWAVESTPGILALLEEYFGRPYPYEKLDHLAVPLFFGAMEHPGLVTYGQTLMLLKPEEQTISDRRRYAAIAAHELAHMWFGNLVTMAWWDDLWLNESFASWLGQKVTDRWRPEWQVRVSAPASRSNALWLDSLAAARKVRQPIASKHDIANAFDGITYVKGEAVLTMFESWLGEEAFRRGVRRYLAAHEWGSATASDFLAAQSAEAGRDVAPAFSSFLDQTGAPLVSARVECAATAAVVALEQKPYRRLGSRDASVKTWQVPVCVRYGTGATAGRQCTLLAGPSARLDLSSATRCPEWLLANDGESGYYRPRHERDMLTRLLENGGHRLTAAERVGIAGDIDALVSSGDLTAGEALALMAGLASDPNPHVVEAVVGVVRGLGEMVPEALRPRYAAFVRELFGGRARELGWTARPGEDEDTRLLRKTLVSVVVSKGEDAGLGGEAAALATRWLVDPRAVDPDMVAVMLSAAARYGDRALFDRFNDEVRKTPDRDRREKLFSALGSFRDQDAAGKALRMVLDEALDVRESFAVVWAANRDRDTRGRAYSFVQEHYDEIVRRLPEGSVFSTASYLPWLGGWSCTEDQRARLESFFKPRVPGILGAPRVLAEVLESIDLCIAQRRTQQPNLISFLESRGGPER
jgi:alanyl aminopeptidase